MTPADGIGIETAARNVAQAAGATRKQAVVLIHGIGEQAPLQTLRSFVETVYEKDHTLTQMHTALRTIVTPTVTQRVKQTWMVPDDATGTAELRRISTTPDAEGLRTDFFEFYWADIMTDTPLAHVLSWLRGLLLRSPFAVPRDIRIWQIWLVLWALTGLALIFLASTFGEGKLFETLSAGARAGLLEWRYVLATVAGIAGLLLVVLRFLNVEVPVPRVRLLLPLMLMVIGVGLLLLPADLLGNAKVWSAALTAIGALVLAGIVAPFAGDIVRYVRATPSTVEKRQMVRERGLKLLEALHRRRNGIPDYERIIVVGHSLGTIIGYDLIQLYWEQAGPTHHRPPLPEGARPVMSALDVMVKQKWVDGIEDGKFDIDEYQRRQGWLFETLRTQPNIDFRISDFITLGSPLTHAEFLIADDLQQLLENFDLRLLSSAPPRPNRPWRTMIYGENDWSEQPSQFRYLHFAAAFSAVRWTNIYDKSGFAPLGDTISGALRSKFGPGIRDLDVKIQRWGFIPFWKRRFTHTLYWGWDTRFAAPPEHVQLLRDALDLGWTGPEGIRPDSKLGKEVGPSEPTGGQWPGEMTRKVASALRRDGDDPAARPAPDWQPWWPLESGSRDVPITPATPWEEERPPTPFEPEDRGAVERKSRR